MSAPRGRIQRGGPTRPARRRLAIVAAMVLGALGAAACDGGNGVDPTPEVQILETYTLRTIDGNELPFLLEETPTQRTSVVSGTINLHSNGTFRDVITYEVTGNGSATPQGYQTQLFGAFTEDEDGLHFEPNNGTLPYTLGSDGNGGFMTLVGDYELGYGVE